MTSFLRVKDKSTGHELSVPAPHYDANRDAYTKVDKPAADTHGAPLPPKYKTTVAKQAATRRRKRKTTTANPAAAQPGPDGRTSTKETS